MLKFVQIRTNYSSILNQITKNHNLNSLFNDLLHGQHYS
jgi:hypothetical protein